MLKIETKADLQGLIDDEIQESLTLDYKASGALAKDSKSRDELCKDVSAFANSAGGQIVYGIEEKDRKPVAIDGGTNLTREWLEQVIDSNIQPRVEGLVIRPIPLDSGYGYILTIPQATTYAPHQAADHKYYYRQNFQSVPMEDYQVRDALKRVTHPEVYVRFLVRNGSLAWPIDGNHSSVFSVVPVLENHSRQPAMYTMLTLQLDDALIVNNNAEFIRTKTAIAPNEDKLVLYSRAIAPPKFLPIFTEMPLELGPLTFSIPEKFKEGETWFWFGYSIATPGFMFETMGRLWVRNKKVSIVVSGPRDIGVR